MRRTDSLVKLLAQPVQSLCTPDGIVGLNLDGAQKEDEPFLPLVLLADREQPALVLLAVLVEVGAEVKERLGKKLLHA